MLLLYSQNHSSVKHTPSIDLLYIHVNSKPSVHFLSMITPKYPFVPRSSHLPAVALEVVLVPFLLQVSVGDRFQRLVRAVHPGPSSSDGLQRLTAVKGVCFSDQGVVSMEMYPSVSHHSSSR